MGNREQERRFITARELRVEDGEGDAGPMIRGYAAVFNVWSEDLSGFRERIQPGAFAKTVSEADVRALWNHNADFVLGRTKSGTLSLREDEVGLYIEAQPPDAQWARDAVTSIRRGDVDQMSFGFDTIRDEWSNEGEQVQRTLVEVRLFDVSPVTFPAYPQTSAQVRARVADFDTSAPGQAHHPEADDDGEWQARLDLMRRRLELAELEFGLTNDGGEE